MSKQGEQMTSEVLPQIAVSKGAVLTPDTDAQRQFVLNQVRRVQPAAFNELLDVTGLQDAVLAVRLDELLAEKALMQTRGVSRRYYSIYKEVSL